MKSVQTALLALAVLTLSGCGSSPPVHYHALNAASPPQSSGSARLLVEILPIALPERLDRVEMVLSTSAGQLDVRDSDHWAAPLSDEVRQLLSDALWDRLQASDTYQAPVAANASGLSQYRLALRIERFEAVPGRNALVQGSWTARRLPQGQSATCRASISVPLPATSTEAAATALSDGTAQLSRLVADSIDRLNQNNSNACPPGAS